MVYRRRIGHCNFNTGEILIRGYIWISRIVMITRTEGVVCTLMHISVLCFSASPYRLPRGSMSSMETEKS